MKAKKCPTVERLRQEDFLISRKRKDNSFIIHCDLYKFSGKEAMNEDFERGAPLSSWLRVTMTNLLLK